MRKVSASNILLIATSLAPGVPQVPDDGHDNDDDDDDDDDNDDDDDDDDVHRTRHSAHWPLGDKLSLIRGVIECYISYYDGDDDDDDEMMIECYISYQKPALTSPYPWLIVQL